MPARLGLIRRATAFVVAVSIGVVSVLVMLAFAVAMVSPATAQGSSDECRPGVSELSLAPGTATLCRFDKPVQTLIPGDENIVEARRAGDDPIGSQIVVLLAKKVGTTNVILMDATGNEMLNATVAVTQEAIRGAYRVTMHTLRADIKKFWVYRCAPERLCELVEEPKVIVTRETETGTEAETTTEGPALPRSAPPQ